MSPPDSSTRSSAIRPGVTIGVVEADGAGSLTGFAILGQTPATTGTWHLYWIAVEPRCHGTGAAQRLLRQAEDLVRTHRGRWLLAETSGRPDYGRTRQFYRKEGFEQLARIPDYYTPGDDLIIFGKRVHL